MLLACYGMVELVVFPSSFEPCGLVVHVVICCELSIIASDYIGAAADLVRIEVNEFSCQ